MLSSSTIAIGVGVTLGVAQGVAVVPDSVPVLSGDGLGVKVGVAPLASWLLVSLEGKAQVVWVGLLAKRQTP